MALHTIRLREPWDRQADAQGCISLLRRFRAPTGLGEGHCVHLAAHGLTSPATVFLNGELLGSLDEGASQRWEITSLLRERNEVRLALQTAPESDADGGRNWLVRLEIEEGAAKDGPS
jgi:hypothetical protein